MIDKDKSLLVVAIIWLVACMAYLVWGYFYESPKTTSFANEVHCSLDFDSGVSSYRLSI